MRRGPAFLLALPLALVVGCGGTSADPAHARTSFVAKASQYLRALSITPSGGRVAYIGKHDSSCGSVYVYEVATGVNRCASPNPAATGQISQAYEVAISADGRHVAYVAWNSRKWTPPDQERSPCAKAGHDECADVFAYDLDSGRTTVVSVAPGRETGRESSNPSISGDGRFVVFWMGGAGLLLRDRDSDEDGLLDEAGAARTTLIKGGGSDPVISADGRFIASAIADGSNTFGPFGEGSSIVVQDLRSGERAVIGRGAEPSLSADGRLVAFTAPKAGAGGVYVHDRSTKETTLISGPEPDAPPLKEPPLSSEHPSISADGRFVTFVSEHLLTRTAADACPEPEPPIPMIYVRDLQRAETALVSISRERTCPDGFSHSAAVAAGGNLVAFIASGTNFDPLPGRSGPALYLRMSPFLE
jgi:Tol biopolymer transport system component